MNLSSLQHLLHERQTARTRRWFFRDCALGLGSMALGSLLGQGQGQAASLAESARPNPFSPKPAPHFARAKRVIYLFMAGAPSHLELFDHKPARGGDESNA